MPDFTYETFDLLVEAADGGYRVRVINSPAGQASAKFASPFDPTELDSFLARVGRRGPIMGTAVKPEDLVKQFGGRLFDAVFKDEVQTSYRRSRDIADSRGKGLRIRLRLNDVPALADLPWEYLYDASRQKFLALSKETPIVRFLDLPEPITPLAAPAPLNLLAVMASPTDYDELDVEAEWSNLQTALKDLIAQKQVTLTHVLPPTLDALRAQLRKADYHVMHFVGHGEFDKTSQRGALVFEDAAKNGRAVSDEQIATLLNDTRALRMVLLDACEGARTSVSNPFAGVAPRLIQQGIPAVMAMQFAISDPAAVQFSSEFYRTLADGYPVDAAVNEGRRATYLSGNVLEWGTPVLFMRADDGMIFVREGGNTVGKPTSDDQGPRHGGINISGDAHVSVGRDMVSGDKIVNGDEYDVGGDFNSVTIGAGAQVGQVAAGRNIQQSSGGGGDDKNDLAAKLLDVQRAFSGARAQVDPAKLALLEYQFQQLLNELTKMDGAPNAWAVTSAADSLSANVPALGGPLGALFKSSAGQRLVKQAGIGDWAKNRFG